VLSNAAAAVVADCVLNCSLGYAVVASDSSITLARSSLAGVASVRRAVLALVPRVTLSQGVLALRSHVSLVSSSISSTGPSLNLRDLCVASLTASSVVSAATSVVCETSCVMAYKSILRGKLSTAAHATESFMILLECNLSRADKLLSASRSSSIMALDCSFADTRLGIDAACGAALLVSRCSFTNMKESAISASACAAVLQQCRVSGVASHALNVMGGCRVQAVDCVFERCGSVALVAGLQPADYEAYLKFLWRWKRESSKEKHSAVTLQLDVQPCRLLLAFDRDQHAAVYVLQGGAVDCSSRLQRQDLSASADASALSQAQEDFVQGELDRIQGNREKVLARCINIWGLNSLRTSFDKWNLASVAAANQRMLAEEAARAEQAARLAALEAESNESESDTEVEDAALGGSVAARDKLARFEKKKLRRELKLRQQVAYVFVTFCV
jgi:hypothetical protein